MKIKERQKAIALRKRGFSLKEIAGILGVAKSSVSVWVRRVELSAIAEKRLLTKITLGQFIAARNKKAKTAAIEDRYFRESEEALKKMNIHKDYAKLLCAIMYWCEGAKDARYGVRFTNSDPTLVKKFLELLRASFSIDEKRFRVCVHIHEYHSPQKQIKLWSEITHIPIEKFIKPFLKNNTGRRKREGYQGTASIRYNSNDLARRLMAIARVFLGA